MIRRNSPVCLNRLSRPVQLILFYLPKEIALELGRLSRHPFIKANGVKRSKEDLIDNSDPDLKIIIQYLYKAAGVDFSVYKMTTIKRRIIRRMLLYKIKSLKEYAKMLGRKKQ